METITIDTILCVGFIGLFAGALVFFGVLSIILGIKDCIKQRKFQKNCPNFERLQEDYANSRHEALKHKQKCDEIVENIDTLYRQKELVVKNKIPVIEERLEEEKIKLDEALLLWAVSRELINQKRQKIVDYLKSRNELELAEEWKNKEEN